MHMDWRPDIYRMPEELFPEARIDSYPSFNDLFQCVKQGKIDGFLLDIPNLSAVARTDDRLSWIPVPGRTVEIGIAFGKNEKGARLQSQMNEYLAQIREDGTFTYTPKKNKVGIDSFVYTATDASGKTSRKCTVTVTIVKPTDAPQYTDTLGRECRFAAEWMKNTGIFVGEALDGNACFSPEKPVTQGEFIAMLVRTLDIPTDPALCAGVPQDTPQWLKPYLAAAMRSGMTDGVASGCDREMTGAEAARMIQNILDLTAAEETGAFDDGAFSPDQQILAGHGICLDAGTLTRAQAAQALYRVSQLAAEAPGMVVVAKQR